MDYNNVIELDKITLEKGRHIYKTKKGRKEICNGNINDMWMKR